MPDYSKYYEARDIITDILWKDFVGPVDPEEIISELPGQYYIMGKLYPQNAGGTPVSDPEPSPEEEVADGSLSGGEEADDAYDTSISLANEKSPSSLGVTCTLKPDVDHICLSGSYAFYAPIPYKDAETNGIDISSWEGDPKKKKPRTFWKRQSMTYCHDISLGAAKVTEPVDLAGGLQLQVFTHATLDSGERIITAVLINTNTVKTSTAEESNSLCAFQAVLKLSSPEGNCIFADTDQQTQLSADEEQQEWQLLYSEEKCYGQGHGCSVEWDLDNEEPTWVSSAWFPSYNLHQMVAGSLEDPQVLSMRYLAQAPEDSVLTSLRDFIRAYSRWIDGQQEKALDLEERYHSAAARNIQKCRDARDRMNRSVDLLEESLSADGKAMRAFRLANEALLMQRRQTRIKSGKGAGDPGEIAWYPFQLAFLLHELPSFIEPESEDRETVDLLWFPTGGGKTEAYLGISAFAIFLRRLRNPADDGVTVIMRYTLRLLTLQQFERAGMMICACELLRQKYSLGGSEISIGLWVGSGLTPNSLDKARAALRKKQAGSELSQGETDPCQLRVCPWCGTELYFSDYKVDTQNNRMLIFCSNSECGLHELPNGLPVHLVDEAIYAYRPAFLVATVDKFAQIPLRDGPAALFGISVDKNPPDLIIQDELHLISGPLGTITGLYEAGITKLCEKNGVGAKIIASTATIRNAAGQIRALYGKNHTQFPPQGISVSDSFFAVESDPSERPARKYVGVMGIGTTLTSTLIRVSAAVLFATRYLVAAGYDEDVVDNFWTITEYFNNLRELGAVTTQIEDEVQSRFKYLANTKFADLEPRVSAREKYDFSKELTSRVDNAEISKVIQVYLNRRYRHDSHNDVYDFLLASNMISVGVDVGRLGIMLVNGQPKTNSEYIQATSRVGRDNPGLVVTVYNAGRSRDRSHYEQFLKYHSALYRFVEATSLTPFADRARDKALQALYVSLCRYLVPGMLADDGAGNFDPDRSEVREIEQEICDYVQIVDPDELAAVQEELRDIEEEWALRARGSLAYKGTKQSPAALLQTGTEPDRFRVMNSMRTVDAQPGIYLLRYGG